MAMLCTYLQTGWLKRSVDLGLDPEFFRWYIQYIK